MPITGIRCEKCCCCCWDENASRSTSCLIGKGEDDEWLWCWKGWRWSKKL